MSLGRQYETSKLYTMTSINFTATATRIRLVTPSATMKRKSFMVRTTQAARILQGGDGVGPVTSTNGTYMSTTHRWRIDVDSAQDAYISVVRDSTNGAIEITQLTDAGTDDPPTAV